LKNHIDLNNTQKLKDILSEKIMHIDIGFESYIREISIILNNLSLSFTWNEINFCRDDWEILVKNTSKQLNEDNARKIKSVIDRLK
jgi:hypothetical protein